MRKPISDASPKYVFSLDRFDYSRDGISHINIVDFRLSDGYIVCRNISKWHR